MSNSNWDSIFGGMFGDSNMNLFNTEMYENKLDEMWRIYGKGNIQQLPIYQRQVQSLKDAGYRVLRNSSGKHKVLLKGVGSR